MNIITEHDSIHSCHDFELGIERKTALEFLYSYQKGVTPKGLVFIIAGFGADSSPSYLQRLCEYTAQKFGVLCVSVFYHCFYSRYHNGATLYPDAQEAATLKKHLDEHGIAYNAVNPMSSLLLLDASISKDKAAGITPDETKLIVTFTSFPKNDEYQNFGIMQALDHLNVLNYIKRNLPELQNSPVALVGSSHGAYIANLCAKIAPSSIDLVIDNSSYAKPQYKFFLGREFDPRDPEYFNRSSFNNIVLYFFTKTYWTLDSDSPHFFSNAHYRMRDLTDDEHMRELAKLAKKPRYISYHAKLDLIAPHKDKELFYGRLKEHGFDATLHTISEESQIDGHFIKHLNHAMDMSIKELINRELDKLFESKESGFATLEPLTFECNSLIYAFGIEGSLFSGKLTANERQSQLINNLRENFTKNSAYLQTSHPKLFDTINALESAVEQKLYKNKFELVLKDQSIEVFDIKLQQNLIGMPSQKYLQAALSMTNLQRDNGVFEGFKKVTISDEMVAKYASLDIYANNLSGHADIINFTASATKEPMKHADKSVFFGVGVHLAPIAQKLDSDEILIVEGNLELFRLSLFFTPYYELAKKAELFFAVFDANFTQQAQRFINHNFYKNHYIKYFQAPHQSDDSTKEFHLQIASQSHLLFYYSSILEQYTRPLGYIKNGFNILNILKPLSDFGTKPVLLLAAGPSLQKEMEWLKHNHQNFIIVALSAVLSILEANAICPDIITHLDGFSESDILFERVCDMNFFKDSIFLLASRTPQNIIERLNKERVFLFESGTFYKDSHGSLNAFCVGSTTYLLLIALGVQNLYLLGLDLALSDSGATHIESHPLMQTLDLSTQDSHQDTMIFNDNIVEVRGNFTPTVRTTSGFATSISSINATNTSFKTPSQRVYNLSHGAQFANTIPLLSSSCAVEPFDKQALRIFEEFSANSSNIISASEYQIAQTRLDLALAKNETLANFSSALFKNSDEFLEALKTLIKELCDSQNSDDYDLAFIFQEYLKLTSGYIFDYFNTHASRDVASLHAMLSKHLLDISTIYINSLKDYLCMT